MQGAFVEAARDAGRPGRAARSLLVLLDEEPYLARLGDDGAERLAQRRRAWERMLRAAGVAAAVLPPALDARGRAPSPTRAPRSPGRLVRRRLREPLERAAPRTSCSRSSRTRTSARRRSRARSLRRDVGEVLDQAHVTDATERFVLHEADGASLVLSDNPGFGDSVRLLRRLRGVPESARLARRARCGTASATARSSAARRRRATCATRPTPCSTS